MNVTILIVNLLWCIIEYYGVILIIIIIIIIIVFIRTLQKVQFYTKLTVIN
jgi:hypothetical protein